MTDQWNMQNNTEPTPAPQEPTVPMEESIAESILTQEFSSVQESAPSAAPTLADQEPIVPMEESIAESVLTPESSSVPESAPTTEPNPIPVQAPAAQQPPVNSWSNDGSYRYVPPRPQPPTPPPAYHNPYYQQPSQPRYQSPINNGGQTPPINGGYTPPAGGFTPPVQPVQPPVQQPVQQPSQPPRKKGSGWITVVAVLGALAVVASVVLIAFGASQMLGNNPDPDVSDTVISDGSNSSVNENAPTLEIDTWDTNDGGLSTEEIVARNYDSTVVLTAYAQTTNFYFGESNLTEVAGASGIIMTADGYIITNRHCVINEQTGKKYDRIDVATYDGTVYESATVIGTDEATDLAVIKVEAKNLTPAQFGDSDELAVGARVVALGNAAGLSWTATQGIVSAKARDVYDDTGYAIKCLQVDVAINSGNSGGPLLNKQGLVVGINSAKIAASGYEGLGFSIPINEAKVVIDSLLKNGYVKGRVALGITGQTVSSGMYKGFMIVSIADNSSFKGTDARINDLIVEVDGVTVTDYGTLRSELAKHQVGDTVKLKLLRSDQRTGQVSSLYVTVTLKEQTAE